MIGFCGYFLYEGAGHLIRIKFISMNMISLCVCTSLETQSYYKQNIRGTSLLSSENLVRNLVRGAALK